MNKLLQRDLSISVQIRVLHHFIDLLFGGMIAQLLQRVTQFVLRDESVVVRVINGERLLVLGRYFYPSRHCRNYKPIGVAALASTVMNSSADTSPSPFKSAARNSVSISKDFIEPPMDFRTLFISFRVTLPS